MKKKILTYQMRVSNDGTQYKGALVDIDNTLEAKQEYVGGLIQVLCINGIDIICNDEGKLMGLPVNRVLLDEKNNILDIFVGNILCCRHNDDGDFTDISPDDIETIERMLKPCEVFPHLGVVTLITSELPEYKGA